MIFKSNANGRNKMEHNVEEGIGRSFWHWNCQLLEELLLTIRSYDTLKASMDGIFKSRCTYQSTQTDHKLFASEFFFVPEYCIFGDDSTNQVGRRCRYKT